MGAHWSVTSEGASRVAVAGIGEGVVFDLVIPRFYQLKNRSIPAKQRNTSLIRETFFLCLSTVFPSMSFYIYGIMVIYGILEGKASS